MNALRPTGHCRTGKVGYSSHGAAQDAADKVTAGKARDVIPQPDDGPLRPYLHDCGKWHLTRNPVRGDDWWEQNRR